MSKPTRLIAGGIVLLSSACGDLECGLGTYEREGQCVPNLVVACGTGTRYERGYCIAVDVPSDSDASESDVPELDE